MNKLFEAVCLATRGLPEGAEVQVHGMGRFVFKEQTLAYFVEQHREQTTT